MEQLENALKSSTKAGASGGTGGAFIEEKEMQASYGLLQHSNTQRSQQLMQSHQSINENNFEVVSSGVNALDRQSLFSNYTSQNGSFQVRLEHLHFRFLKLGWEAEDKVKEMGSSEGVSTAWSIINLNTSQLKYTQC